MGNPGGLHSIMESVHNWVGLCSGWDTNDFFDNYEESVLGDQVLARQIDAVCESCPYNSRCLAFAVTHKEYGVWGGTYVEEGRISKLYNSHKSPEDWGRLWLAITHD